MPPPYRTHCNPSQSHLKGPTTQTPPTQPANHFAYDLPPIRTLPGNWNRPGPCWKRFTTHRELTSRRQDMPLKPLTTLGAPVATPILDHPEIPGTPLHPNNQPPLPSKASSMHSERTWIRNSPPSPTSSATTAVATEATLQHHTQRPSCKTLQNNTPPLQLATTAKHHRPRRGNPPSRRKTHHLPIHQPFTNDAS